MEGRAFLSATFPIPPYSTSLLNVAQVYLQSLHALNKKYKIDNLHCKDTEKGFHLFLKVSNIAFYVAEYAIFLSFDWHMSDFHLLFLSIMNNTAMDKDVQVFVSVWLSDSFEYRR